LLRTNDIQLQKAALSCVFNFKNKSLTPYREHFDNLVDEKAFRTELLHFSVGEENTILADEDRTVVIPVLLNLLNGKMHTRTKKNIPRRPLIFRFVAGCRPEELELFLQTTFWAINDLIGKFTFKDTEILTFEF
jgi:U3 small nucleolar RNA-associated protein 20